MPEPAAAVTIETERLLLRPYALAHFEAATRLNAAPETFRFSERGPMSKEESWSRILRNIGHWAALGYGLFAVEEKANGRFVGEAGLANFNRSLGDRFDPYPEASWTIGAEAQGRGYATEAAAAALDWIERRRGAQRSVCLINRSNAPSLRVAEKLGYRAFAETEYRGYPAILFERGRPSA